MGRHRHTREGGGGGGAGRIAAREEKRKTACRPPELPVGTVKRGSATAPCASPHCHAAARLRPALHLHITRVSHCYPLSQDRHPPGRSCRPRAHAAICGLHRMKLNTSVVAYLSPSLTITVRRTAIHLAARSGHVPMLRLLLESRPVEEQEQLANAPDFFGLTPVFLALQRWACVLAVC